MTGQQIGGLIGLFGGLLCGGAGWWYGRYQLARHRGLDERYEAIRIKARATGWQITFAAMVIMYLVVILGGALRPIHVLSILYAVHVGAWAACVIYYQWKL